MTDASAPAPAPAPAFPVGCRVELHSLKGAAHHNGRTGTVIGPLNDATGRFPVTLFNTVNLSLRPANLRPSPAPPLAMGADIDVAGSPLGREIASAAPEALFKAAQHDPLKKMSAGIWMANGGDPERQTTLVAKTLQKMGCTRAQANKLARATQSLHPHSTMSMLRMSIPLPPRGPAQECPMHAIDAAMKRILHGQGGSGLFSAAVTEIKDGGNLRFAHCQNHGSIMPAEFGAQLKVTLAAASILATPVDFNPFMVIEPTTEMGMSPAANGISSHYWCVPNVYCVLRSPQIPGSVRKRDDDAFAVDALASAVQAKDGVAFYGLFLEVKKRVWRKSRALMQEFEEILTRAIPMLESRFDEPGWRDILLPRSGAEVRRAPAVERHNCSLISYDLGEFLESRGAYAAAAERYRKAALYLEDEEVICCAGTGIAPSARKCALGRCHAAHGLALRRTGDLDGAEAAYRRGLDAVPGDRNLLGNLATLARIRAPGSGFVPEASQRGSASHVRKTYKHSAKALRAGAGPGGMGDGKTIRFCQKCNASDRSVTLSACSRCRLAFYCSPECQRSHWLAHKADCKRLRRAMSKTNQVDRKGAGER